MLRNLLKVSGIIIMFYIVINFYFFLIVAMLNDGVVVIYFNRLGEGTFEYIMYILLAPLLVLSFVLELKSYVSERKKLKELRKLERKRTVPNRDTEGSVRDTT